MNKPENFEAIVNFAMRHEGRHHMRPVIEKELLHYDILFALDKENLLDKLTFQGGTLLRLCYGAPRYSEDLDFCGGKDFNKNDLIDIKACIEEHIGKRYNLEVSVKEPRQVQLEPEIPNIKVDKWQVSVTTARENRDIPKQKIKIEVINIPSYSRIPKTLQRNYDFLPDGYSDIFIMCETLDEVYADKVISLANCEKYVRYRDIWDLHWLAQHNAKINGAFILNKIEDYGIINYTDKLALLIQQLSTLIHSTVFRQQMSRFLPIDIQERTLNKDKFYDILTAELMTLFEQVKLICK